MKKTLTTIASIILWIVILLAAFFAFVTLATKDKTQVSMVFGHAMLRVKSDSMAPTFETDDWIMIESVDPAELRIGDVITFADILATPEGNIREFNTHRIVEIENFGSNRNFITRGDNVLITENDEGYVSDSEVQGRFVCVVPILGPLLNLLSNPTGFLCIIVLPILAFFIFQVYKLITIGSKYRKAVAAEAAQEAAANLDPDSAAAQLAAKEAELERLKAELAKANGTAGGEASSEKEE